jgi:hypothetical protein
MLSQFMDYNLWHRDRQLPTTTKHSSCARAGIHPTISSTSLSLKPSSSWPFRARMRLTVVNTATHRMVVHAIVSAQLAVGDARWFDDSLDRPDEFARRCEVRKAKAVDFPFRSPQFCPARASGNSPHRCLGLGPRYQRQSPSDASRGCPRRRCVGRDS